MGNKSRFAVAEGIIKSFFKQSSKRVFSRGELAKIFEEKRSAWSLPITSNSNKFIGQLLSRDIFKSIEIPFDGYILKQERFLNEAVPDDGNTVFHIAASLINKSYLSHYTAVYLHGLTTQVPKTVCITFEQSKKNVINQKLDQKAVDAAFSKPQRTSNTKGIYKDYAFVIHNGMYTNRSGVYSANGIPLTNIERTLIDITVRPTYAGGVHEVLDVYRDAIPKVSMNKLIATLETINFIYPYHQAIGFYLERAGYEGKKLDQLREKKMEIDFYLTYEMEEKDYSKEWRLYYPRGM